MNRDLEKTDKKEIEEDFMCFPVMEDKHGNNMSGCGKGLETDIPNLEKKIKQHMLLKLVPQLQSGSTKSSLKFPHLNIKTGNASDFLKASSAF
jgi:hypothetical protein